MEKKIIGKKLQELEKEKKDTRKEIDAMER